MTFPTAASPALRVDAFALTNRALLVAVSALLFLPSAIFATGLRLLPALVVLAGCLGALVIVTGRTSSNVWGVFSAPIDALKLSGSIAFAVVLLLLGGETHVFFPTWDWTLRDAVLADLVRNGFPTGYRVGATDYLLRAPLGMYMAPAVAGRAFGLFAAHLTLLVQNGAILGVIFYLLAAIGRGTMHVIVLVLFSGLSIVGAVLRTMTVDEHRLPFWLQWGLDAWHPMFQYSGTLVQFFWVPNHALPGWWLATLLLLQVRRQVDVATIGVTVAGALLWSPLCIIPVVPWLLLCAVRQPKVLLDPRTLGGAASAACFLPILIYLIVAATSIDSGSTIEKPDFLTWYALFVVLALAPLGFLFMVRTFVEPSDRMLLALSAMTLLVLPFFRFGPNNDLVMRGSIVALTVVAFALGDVVVRLTRERARAATAGWILVAACAPSAMVELGRAVMTPPYAISDCTVMEATSALGDAGLPTNYIARAELVPDWLVARAKVSMLSADRTTCWPDRVKPRFVWPLPQDLPAGQFPSPETQRKKGPS